MLPAQQGAVDPAVRATEACALVHGEVAGFQADHPVMLRFHQLSADAYAAQHAGEGTPLIRVGYALAGLWLSIEHGFSGEDVRAVHRRMGRPTADWPAFGSPPAPPRRWMTVVDVADVGVRARSEAGHARAVALWSESVWQAWCEETPGTDDAVEEMLRRIFLETGHADRLHGTIGAAAAVHRLTGLLEA